MRFSYITDKDFLPEHLAGGHYGNDVEKVLCQVVYGSLYDNMSYEDVSDLIVRISRDIHNEITKKFILLEVKKEIKTIIDKLKRYLVKDDEVIVLIPFTDDYARSVSDTISLFKLVIFTIDAIIEKGDTAFELEETPNYTYPVTSVTMLFLDFLWKYQEILSGGDTSQEDYWREVIVDEMIRRNIYWSPEFGYDQSLHYKSKLYNQPERFYETVAWGKRLRIDTDEEAGSADVIPNAASPQTYFLGEAGIVYFMLKDIEEENDERRKKKKIVSLINYYLGTDWFNDTTRSYVDKFKQMTSKSHSMKFYQTVKEALEEYNFDVPKVIEEGTEIKGRKRRT